MITQQISLNEMALIGFGNPTVEGDGDTLHAGADKINANFLELYTKINGFAVSTVDSATPTTEGIVKYDGVTIQKNLAGQLTVLFPSVPTVDSIPIGIIAMWSGAPSAIPTGWALCDGTNGRPNLLGRFIVGYNPSDTNYSMGNTGGTANTVVPTHQHSFSAQFTTNPHTHSINDAGHTHTFPEYRDDANDDGPGIDSSNLIHTPSKTFTTANNVTGISLNATQLAGTITGSTDNIGTDGTNKNLPPYYVLAYIIKT